MSLVTAVMVGNAERECVKLGSAAIDGFAAEVPFPYGATEDMSEEVLVEVREE